MSNKKRKEKVEESSTTANIVGYSAPFSEKKDRKKEKPWYMKEAKELRADVVRSLEQRKLLSEATPGDSEDVKLLAAKLMSKVKVATKKIQDGKLTPEELAKTDPLVHELVTNPKSTEDLVNFSMQWALDRVKSGQKKYKLPTGGRKERPVMKAGRKMKRVGQGKLGDVSPEVSPTDVPISELPGERGQGVRDLANAYRKLHQARMYGGVELPRGEAEEFFKKHGKELEGDDWAEKLARAATGGDPSSSTVGVDLGADIGAYEKLKSEIGPRKFPGVDFDELEQRWNTLVDEYETYAEQGEEPDFDPSEHFSPKEQAALKWFVRTANRDMFPPGSPHSIEKTRIPRTSMDKMGKHGFTGYEKAEAPFLKKAASQMGGDPKDLSPIEHSGYWTDLAKAIAGKKLGILPGRMEGGAVIERFKSFPPEQRKEAMTKWIADRADKELLDLRKSDPEMYNDLRDEVLRELSRIDRDAYDEERTQTRYKEGIPSDVIDFMGDEFEDDGREDHESLGDFGEDSPEPEEPRGGSKLSSLFSDRELSDPEMHKAISGDTEDEWDDAMHSLALNMARHQKDKKQREFDRKTKKKIGDGKKVGGFFGSSEEDSRSGREVPLGLKDESEMAQALSKSDTKISSVKPQVRAFVLKVLGRTDLSPNWSGWTSLRRVGKLKGKLSLKMADTAIRNAYRDVTGEKPKPKGVTVDIEPPDLSSFMKKAEEKPSKKKKKRQGKKARPFRPKRKEVPKKGQVSKKKSKIKSKPSMKEVLQMISGEEKKTEFQDDAWEDSKLELSKNFHKNLKLESFFGDKK